jgi:hypothetical protein
MTILFGIGAFLILAVFLTVFLAAIVAGIAEMISTWRDDERY